MASIYTTSARNMHAISGHVILLGFFLLSYGIFFDINLITVGVISMICGSSISIVSMRSDQERIYDEFSVDA